MVLLHYSEKETWKLTPYKLTRLFRIHREYTQHKANGTEKSQQINGAAIDIALGGL